MIPSRHSKPRYIQTPHGVCSDSVLRKGTRSGYSSLHPHLPLDRAVFSIAEHGLSQRYALTSPPLTIANPFDSISLRWPPASPVKGPNCLLFVPAYNTQQWPLPPYAEPSPLHKLSPNDPPSLETSDYTPPPPLSKETTPKLSILPCSRLTVVQRHSSKKRLKTIATDTSPATPPPFPQKLSTSNPNLD